MNISHVSFFNNKLEFFSSPFLQVITERQKKVYLIAIVIFALLGVLVYLTYKSLFTLKEEDDSLSKKLEGDNTRAHPDGSVGDGLLHGLGKIILEDGEIQDGLFEHGKFVKGKITLANGDEKEGNFPHDGDKHDELLFEHGQFVQRTITLANGRALYGKGTKKLVSAGEVHEGIFKADQLNGLGKITFANKDTFEGEFENGKLHGKGIKTLFDGNLVQDGEFGRGELIEGYYKQLNADPNKAYTKTGKFVHRKLWQGLITYESGRCIRMFEGYKTSDYMRASNAPVTLEEAYFG